jgi:Tol biopolymer transport system component
MRPIGLAVALAAVLAPFGRTQDTFRVSIDSTAAQGSHDSSVGSMSSDGRFIALQSRADNLVDGDTNGVDDVFVHDALTGATERVSVDSAGVQGDAISQIPSISADGRYVAFSSRASNLAPGGAGGIDRVYVHDRITGTTTMVSVDSSGNPGDKLSGWGAISGNGQVVAFDSSATNLVAGDTNGVDDIFVHDLTTGITERVSVDSSGNQCNDLCFSLVSTSDDGQVVEFCSNATNLVAGDTNGVVDVFVHDRTTGVTERVSVDSSGNQSNGFSETSLRAGLSSDGSIVVFDSLGTNLVAGDTNRSRDIFVHNRATGVTERVSIDSSGAEADFDSYSGSLSTDGMRVVFFSYATNLVSGDTNFCADVFLHDRSTGITERESVGASGAQSNADSVGLISGDGLSVAFTTLASNLVANDTNNQFDAFVRGVCPTLAYWANYGAGFPGSNGVPSFTTRQNPVLGTTINLDLSNSGATSTTTLLIAGFDHAALPSSWGGELLVTPTLILPTVLPAGGATFDFAIPNDFKLAATALDLQALELDAGAAHGISFTPGLALVFGN